ncbi:hypothetical protein GIB67_001930 [Kingdonia uniflora]|uniref:CCHC-type domain-containing protein n=1 Tax=Kingdonia uniflora TaxID=39325 RepID=A0A7J7NVI7_9MAGN|nr:hypothetical protein GIB67_001930 [Kingdonia uniflora]
MGGPYFEGAQLASRQCWNCGEMGHVKQHCPVPARGPRPLRRFQSLIGYQTRPQQIQQFPLRQFQGPQSRQLVPSPLGVQRPQYLGQQQGQGQGRRHGRMYPVGRRGARTTPHVVEEIAL